VSTDVTKVGSWTVHKGTVVDPDGISTVLVINDGTTEFVTSEDGAHLLVALAQHLGVEKFEATK